MNILTIDIDNMLFSPMWVCALTPFSWSSVRPTSFMCVLNHQSHAEVSTIATTNKSSCRGAG